MDTAVENVCFVGIYGHEQNDVLRQGLREHCVSTSEAGVDTTSLDGPILSRVPLYPMKPTLNWFGRFPSWTLPLLFVGAFTTHLAITWGVLFVNASTVRDADVLVVPHLGDTAVLVVKPLTIVLGTPLVYISHNGLSFTLIENRSAVPADSFSADFLRRLDRLMQKWADRTVVFSAYSGEILAEAFGLPVEKYGVVYIGVQESKFSRERVGSSTDGPDVLYWGNFIPHHGVGTMVDAAAARPEYEFVFVGDSEQRERIVTRAREQGVENVSFPGFVSDERLAQYIYDASVVLGPLGDYTQTAMNIGTKVAEAASLKKAIVFGDHPAPNEVFDHRRSALLVEPESEDSLVSALDNVLSDDELRERLEDGSYSVYKEYFACDRTASQFLTVAEEAMSSSSGRA